ncbi:hypothetical protein ASD81_04450 [Nocardioides sp. Root614]|nr:hypothetical protein ASD81_04450 [Nocardioides sp. Root614]KRA91900.1 hypothetical protein ASD84_04715 [Nocardioides sp. Root682]
MFDATATQRDVMASIRTDYCGDDARDSEGPATPMGYTFVNCQRGINTILFYVWPDPDSYEISRTAGVECFMSIVIYGPTWLAFTESPTDAKALIDAGGSQGTCS